MVDAHDVAALAARGDLAILRAALQLEEEAVARYVAHGSHSSDPRLVAFWEALRRNEAEHRDSLRERISALTTDDGAAREAAGDDGPTAGAAVTAPEASL